MSAVRRAHDGRIVIIPDVNRVRAMRRRAVPANNHPAGRNLPPTPDEAPVPLSDYQEPTGEPADISEQDSWPLDDAPQPLAPADETHEHHAEPEPTDEPDDDTTDTPEPAVTEPPRGNASKDAWIDYAMAVNIAVDINATRNEIRDYVLDRMSQPALSEGGRLARPEDEPVTREGGPDGSTDQAQA